jgi:DNA-binding NtrC family response regulator
MVNCLLIDRNAGERQLILQILNGLGLNCDERSGTDEAIRFCNERHPDVVLMEASRVSSAKDFLRMVKNKNREAKAPVVILYANTPDVSAMGDTIMQGAADFLMMPMTRDLLQFKLAQAGVALH